jgi:hypothetical protein
MYDNDVVDEESRVAATAVVAAGTTTWLPVDGDETAMVAAFLFCFVGTFCDRHINM